MNPPRQQPKPQGGSSPFLNYLFVAEFADGEIIQQTPEDQSLIEPTKSAFYDVLEKSKTIKLQRFHLANEHNIYTVDLRDGSFEVNGLSFEAHDQYLEIEQPLRLIYFRENHVLSAVDSNSNDKITPYKHYVNRYFIGWQFTKDGKNYQQTIAIR